jgi:rhodanese-related sulfurtransferase
MKTTSLAGVVLAITLGLTGCTVITENATHVDVTKVKQIIDLRTDDAWVMGHLPGAANYDSVSAEFKTAMQVIGKAETVLFYGKDAQQVQNVIDNLAENGYDHLINGGSLEEAARATGLEVTF